MKEIKKISTENHLEVLEELNYGINLVTYESQEAFNLTLKKIEMLNKYFDSNSIEDREAYDIEQPDGSFAYQVPGVRCLLFKKNNVKVPVLNSDNYDGLEILKQTISAGNVSRHLNIDVRLRKFYRNEALIANVRFKDNKFDATKRLGGKPLKTGGGIADQIREAYLSGEKSICFSSYRANLQTIRNAAGSLGRMMNRKFRVEIHGYEIFVIFREFTDQEKDSFLFKNMINCLKEKHTKEHITALFYEFLDFVDEYEVEKIEEEDTIDFDDPVVIEEQEDEDDDF